MTISDAPPLQNPPPPEPVAPSDMFASGRENRLRRWMARFAGFLFKAPRLPWPKVLFGVLWVFSETLLTMASLRPEYWAVGQHNFPGNIFITLLDVHPLAYLGFFLFLALLLGLLMLVINRIFGLALWVMIGFEFFSDIGWLTLNVALYTAEITDRAQVGMVRLLVMVSTALLWGLAFSGGMKVLLAGEDEDTRLRYYPSSLKASLGILTLVVVALSAVTVLNATVPQPTWRRVQTANAPTGRYAISLAYDTSRDQAVLFGGAAKWDDNGKWIGLDDTWIWDGSDWIEQQPALRPPPRLEQAMAYDAKRDMVVMFGGHNQGIALNDTWEWDGAQWTLRTPEVSPPARCCTELAYDPERGQVVLFSGYAPDRTPPAMENVFYYDAWAWDGKNWQEIRLDRNRHVSNYAMLQHPFQQETLFIFDTIGMWAWEGGRISLLDTGLPPGGRYNAGLAYDENRGELYLYGGRQNSSNYTDTWRFDGERWRRVYTVETPPAREMQGLFYDQTRGRIILFGGFDGQSLLNDTWELIVP